MISQDEKRILDSVNTQEIDRIIREAAKTPSSPPMGEEQELAEFFAAELESLGMDFQLQSVEPRRPNVIAYLRGEGGGKSLLFNGHTDTAPLVTSGWVQDPFGAIVEGDKIYGHGLSNMKGSDVAMIGAVAALKKSGVKRRGDVIVTLVMGECRGGQGTRHMLEQGITADYFVNGEPTDLQILLLTSGMCHLKIIVKGRSHHYSIPGKGVNAIEKMMKILGVLGDSNTPIGPGGWLQNPSDKPEYEGLPRFNLGTIKAGVTEDCIEWGAYDTPDHCIATMDIRYHPALSPEIIKSNLEETIRNIGQSDEELNARVEFIEEYRFPPYEAGAHDFAVSTIRQAYVDVVGKEPEVGALTPLKFMGADSGPLQAAGIPGVVCGVGTFAGNMPGEYIEISKLHKLTKIYALTAYRMINSKA